MQVKNPQAWGVGFVIRISSHCNRSGLGVDVITLKMAEDIDIASVDHLEARVLVHFRAIGIFESNE